MVDNKVKMTIATYIIFEIMEWLTYFCIGWQIGKMIADIVGNVKRILHMDKLNREFNRAVLITAEAKAKAKRKAKKRGETSEIQCRF